MGGLPAKPKVQGYIAQEVFVQFQEYCKLHGLSQSAGLEVAVAGFLGIKREQDEKTTTSIEISNIFATEISKLNERVGILERWKLDIESISEDISTADLPSPMAEPTANLVKPVANTSANLNSGDADTLVKPIQSDADTSTGSADPLANLDANPGSGIAEEPHEKQPTKEAIAPSPSDHATSLTRKELGELLGVSHETIRVWQRSGELNRRGWEPVPNTGGNPKNPIRYCRISR